MLTGGWRHNGTNELALTLILRRFGAGTPAMENWNRHRRLGLLHC